MTPFPTIDLNCDMGELSDAVADGSQEAIMPFLTSVNVACGGHAGDDGMMAATIAQARRHNLAIGAHPGYPDRANFGRLPVTMSAGDIAITVYAQILNLGRIAEQQGVSLRHVKPHGALYNSAATNPDIARAIAEGVALWGNDLVLVGLAGSVMRKVFREAGFRVAAEAFADRRYEPDGSLRGRRFADALITDPASAARQVVGMVKEGSVEAVDGSHVEVRADTLCIHGDTAGARAIAEEVARTLKTHGIGLRSL